MGELYDPYPKLPKNIRQIGERDQVVRLYMEDYVNTYLKRLYPTGGQDLRVGLLLGNVEMHEGTPYIFIDGAMEMEGVTEDGEKVEFTEPAWKKAYEDIEQMFPKRTVQGWFLCGTQGCQLSPLNYWKQHGQYFQGKYKLMYLNSGLEGEESVYITSEDGFYKLQGHCIYYERNQMMQDYMILRKDVRRVESGVNDTVIRDFRQRMEDRKQEVTAKRNTVGLLSGACSVLSIMVLAGGIVMFNNYQKMREMESVVASVLPEGSKLLPELKSDLKKQTGTKASLDDDGHVIVEEASGGVYPTEESTEGKTLIITQETLAPAGGTGGQGSGENAGGQDSGQAAGSQAGGQAGGDQGSGQSTGDQGSGQAAGGQASGQDAGAQSDGQETVTREKKDPNGETPQGTQTGAGAGTQTYIVQDGETLYGICIKLYHNLSKIDEICRLNGLDDQDKIISGQKLILP